MNWEERYRDGDTPWDHGEAAPPLLEVLADWPREIWGEGSVLVPGCGRGHDAAVLGRAGHQALGLDLSPSALADGRSRYAGVGNLEFLAGDFMDPVLADSRRVSSIWEHTCFCTLPPEQRVAYVAAAGRWLSEGARLIGVFYLNPEDDDGPPYRVSREEIRTLFAPCFEILREAVPTRFYPSRAGRELLVEMVRTS